MPDRTILVKIASYRDTELMKTIASLLAAADRPEQVHFAIVNQVGEETQGQLDIFASDPRFTVVQIPWNQSLGLGWARRMCDQMWRGQRFTLQLDSHMRFLPSWDTRFIDDWEKTEDPKAVISCYPASYGFEDAKEVYSPTPPHKLISHLLDANGIPSLISGERVAPLSRTLFVAGGLQFSDAQVCQDVPNHESIFYGDESAHSIRLFTHGYNVYAPSKVTAYHLYERHKWMHVEYWSENMTSSPLLANRYLRLRQINFDVMRQLLDPDDTRHIGSVRSKREFNDFSEPFRLYDMMPAEGPTEE